MSIDPAISNAPLVTTVVGLMLQAITGDKLCHTNFAASD